MATRDLPPGTVIGRLPTQRVLTSRDARRSPVGQLLARWERQGATGALPARWYLYVFIASEAAKGAQSAWAPYLQTAPATFDDPLWFDDDERRLLEGSNLALVLAQDEADLRRLYDACFPAVYESFADADAVAPRDTVTWDGIRWARSLYLSRCFPGTSVAVG